jgi:hypothetical protein
MHQTHREFWNFPAKHPTVAGFVRFGVMAIALLFTANVIGRLFYAILGQIPGTSAWNYSLLFYLFLNVSAIAAIVAPKVPRSTGLIAIGRMSGCTMTTYGAAFANTTIGLMALSVGYGWGGGLVLVGIIYLVGACNLLLRLVRQCRNPSTMRQSGWGK